MTEDTLIHEILRETKTFACVGASLNHDRPSYYVSSYLQSQGYRVISINPIHAGKKWLGEVIYPSLADVPPKIEIDALDIFRKSDVLYSIIQDAIKHLSTDLKYIWTQLGIKNEDALELAKYNNLKIIQNRCPKIEIPRLIK